MRELEDGWAHLISEVDGAGLADAADLRHAADKLAHRRLAVVAGAVAVALVATGVAAFARPGPPPPGPTNPPSPITTETLPASPTPSAAATPTTPPTPTPPLVTSVPDRAFVVLPRDMRRAFSTYEPNKTDHVPTLCHNPLAADPTMTMRKSRYVSFADPSDPPKGGLPLGVLTQTISVHRDGGAANVMRRLRTELAKCHTLGSGDNKRAVTTERAPKVGDDAIMFKQAEVLPPNSSDYPRTRRYVVIRIGDVVTVVNVDGWEGIALDRSEADLFARLAAEAINDWR